MLNFQNCCNYSFAKKKYSSRIEKVFRPDNFAEADNYGVKKGRHDI